MHQRIVDPKKLDEDLDNFYLSKYLVTELRDFYTQRERINFFKPVPADIKARTECKKSWPICYKALELAKSNVNHYSLLLKSQFVLSNFKFDHFSTRKLNTVEMYKTPLHQSMNAKITDNDVLMERQRHVCDCKDEFYERMKSEVRLKMSKQVANFDAYHHSNDLHATQKIKKTFDTHLSDPYSEFLRKNTMASQPDDKSDYSNSASQKEHNDPKNDYSNTCRILFTQCTRPSTTWTSSETSRRAAT